ncbi:MAG: hypothetical protein ACKOD3_04980 [Phenylobacterium sp.]
MAGDARETDRDLRVLSAIDEIPSLDPFLLREHLNRRGIAIASCYFSISEADQARMLDFAAMEINNLIRLTYSSPAEGMNYSSKLVQLLLSTDNSEHLEPLRIALRLEGDDYREGVFSWRGFLYYKWLLGDLWPKLIDVLREIPQIKVVGHRDTEQMIYLNQMRRRIIEMVDLKRREVAEALDVYDRAFADLTKNGKPFAFRNFLLTAPRMFLMLGERIGVISHITSFWRYRFPDPRSLSAPADEILDILTDFEQSISVVDS